MKKINIDFGMKGTIWLYLGVSLLFFAGASFAQEGAAKDKEKPLGLGTDGERLIKESNNHAGIGEASKKIAEASMAMSESIISMMPAIMLSNGIGNGLNASVEAVKTIEGVDASPVIKNYFKVRSATPEKVPGLYEAFSTTASLWSGTGHQTPTAADLKHVGLARLLESLEAGDSVLFLLSFKISNKRVYSEAIGVTAKGKAHYKLTYITRGGEQGVSGGWFGYSTKKLLQAMEKNLGKLFSSRDYNQAFGKPGERRDLRVFIVKDRKDVLSYYKEGECREEISLGYYTCGSKWVWGDGTDPAVSGFGALHRPGRRARETRPKEATTAAAGPGA